MRLNTFSLWIVLMASHCMQAEKTFIDNIQVRFGPVFYYEGPTIEFYRTALQEYENGCFLNRGRELFLNAFYTKDTEMYSVGVSLEEDVRPLPSPKDFFLKLKRLYEHKKFD